MSRLTSDELLDEYPSLRFRLETSEQIEEVDMSEFPGNSQRRPAAKAVEAPKQEAPKKEIKKVVSGEVVQRKPSLMKRAKGVFLGGDSHSVKDYVLLEVIIPALKDTIADAVTGGIERMVFGENARPGRRSTRGYGPAVGGNAFNNYAGISNRNMVVTGGPFQNDPRQRQKHPTIDDVIFPTRADAHAVLSGMFELLGEFEIVSISDFLELAGISGNNYMDHKFGWTDLRGVQVHRDRGGFILGLPPAEQIE